MYPDSVGFVVPFIFFLSMVKKELSFLFLSLKSLDVFMRWHLQTSEIMLEVDMKV